MKHFHRLCVLSLALWIGAPLLLLPGTPALAQADGQQTLQLELFAQPLRVDLHNSSPAQQQALRARIAQLEQQLQTPNSQAAQALVASCEHWRTQLKPFFSCHTSELELLWQQAQTSGEVPNRTALRKQVRQLNSQPASLASLPLTWKNAWLLEQLHAFLVHENLSAQLQLGQLSLRHGLHTEQIAALTPHTFSPAQAKWLGNTALPGFTQGTIANATPATNATLAAGEWRIAQRRFSKTLNPADGWPNADSKQVLVFADSALAAQALASALQHMPIQDGLRKTRTLAKGEALVLSHSGRGFASSNWYAVSGDNRALAWAPQQQFFIEYTIPTLAIADYRRPYTALWISSAQEPSVRQLQLQGDSQRWLQELAQWWRRHGRRDTSVIDGLSGASAAPGNYTLQWDGRDDSGKPVAPGQYELHLEVAREHGEREHLRVPFSLSGQDFEVQKQGKKEVGHIKAGLYTSATTAD